MWPMRVRFPSSPLRRTLGGLHSTRGQSIPAALWGQIPPRPGNRRDRHSEGRHTSSAPCRRFQWACTHLVRRSGCLPDDEGSIPFRPAASNARREYTWNVNTSRYLLVDALCRGGAEVARRFHTPKGAGSIPAPDPMGSHGGQLGGLTFGCGPFDPARPRQSPTIFGVVGNAVLALPVGVPQFLEGLFGLFELLDGLLLVGGHGRSRALVLDLDALDLGDEA